MPGNTNGEFNDKKIALSKLVVSFYVSKFRSQVLSAGESPTRGNTLTLTQREML
jgi:hypothetical protein